MHIKAILTAAFFGNELIGFIAIGIVALFLGLSLSMFCFLLKKTRDYEKEERERDS